MDQAEKEERIKIRDKIEKIRKSSFKQQNLNYYRPVPTPKKYLVIFGILGIFLLSVGMILQLQSDSNFVEEIQYETECKDNLQGRGDKPSKCSLEFKVDKDVAGPVYVYYRLDNFYQNHRRYVKSRDKMMLLGQYTEDHLKVSDCDPVTKVEHLWDNQQNSWKNKQDIKKALAEGKDISGMFKPLPAGNIAIPCGLIAKSIFNDTFELKDKDSKQVNINETGIAWETDLEFKFNNTHKEKDLPDGKTWQEVQWYDQHDEHFIVWMRTAGMSDFRKLWGRIDDGLKAGAYKLTVDNQYNVDPFEGKKYFVLATANGFGGKNYFLANCHFVLGVICILFCFVVAYDYKKSKND